MTRATARRRKRKECGARGRGSRGLGRPKVVGDRREIAMMSGTVTLYRLCQLLMWNGRWRMSISASEARRTLFPLIERVNADRDAVEVTQP